MMLLMLFAQDEGARTADVPNAMGAHTWFIIFVVGAFLLWSLSYSLQLHREALARKKGRDDLTRRKDELIDQIAELETQKEAGTIAEKKYKQDLKELKFQLSKTLEKLGTKRGEG
jgi:cytochrome c-type biogenesis protein CcmH/NrfG